MAIACAAMPSPRPVEAQAFGGGRLDADPAGAEPEQPGEAQDHGGAVRADARPLADQGRIDMLDLAARGLDQAARMVEEQRRVGARPARVGRREVAADVASTERAQERVGHRMQADVGIGVADQAQWAGQADAHQHETVAGAEPVDVEAEPRARLQAAGEQPLGTREIRGRRS